MPTAMDIPLTAALTAEQAKAIYDQGEEAVVFALLKLAAQLGSLQQKHAGESHQTPSTPSASKPTYTKPPAKKRRRKPGAKKGHAGTRRPKPTRIDKTQVHRATLCPSCGGDLNRCHETRTRYVEEIPQIQPEVTEHTIHRDWCPQCQKKVEGCVDAALPGSTLGNRVLVLSAWLHYALGNTLAQLIEVFNFHLHLKISAGGLMQMWHRLAEILFDWYQQIHQQALDSAVLHADETGWRVKGKTHWLWCFTNRSLTYYMIDRSRGSPAVAKFFHQEFGGTLVSDFWGAYNAVCCAARQTCLVHLLRELQQTQRYKSPGEHWPAFSKKLRRLVGDAIRLWRKKSQLGEDDFARLRQRLDDRLAEMIEAEWQDSHAKRLVKRLRRHREDLFTFLDREDVPFENNHAEREVRPAVISRKNSFGNRSERGAVTQAVLMSVFRTLKQRGHDPVPTVVEALRHYLTKGTLPPLPEPRTTSDS